MNDDREESLESREESLESREERVESGEESLESREEIEEISNGEEESEKVIYSLEPDYEEAVRRVMGRMDEDGIDNGFGESLQRAMESMAAEINEGKIGDDTALLLAQGLDYQRAIQAARISGETAGRNAQIEERLLSDMDTDGIPHPGCGQGAPLKGKSNSIFDLAREAL